MDILTNASVSFGETWALMLNREEAACLRLIVSRYLAQTREHLQMETVDWLEQFESKLPSAPEAPESVKTRLESVKTP